MHNSSGSDMKAILSLVALFCISGLLMPSHTSLEKGDHITIRNCILHDSGNGLFVAAQSRDVLIEGNYLYDNGNDASIYEHNSYTAATGNTFQVEKPVRPFRFTGPESSNTLQAISLRWNTGFFAVCSGMLLIADAG